MSDGKVEGRAVYILRVKFLLHLVTTSQSSKQALSPSTRSVSTRCGMALYPAPKLGIPDG